MVVTEGEEVGTGGMASQYYKRYSFPYTTSTSIVVSLYPRERLEGLWQLEMPPEWGTTFLGATDISSLGPQVRAEGQAQSRDGGSSGWLGGWLAIFPSSSLCPCKEVAFLTSMGSPTTAFVQLPLSFGVQLQSQVKLRGHAHLQARPGSQGHSRPKGTRGGAGGAVPGGPACPTRASSLPHWGAPLSTALCLQA